MNSSNQQVVSSPVHLNLANDIIKALYDSDRPGVLQNYIRLTFFSCYVQPTIKGDFVNYSEKSSYLMTSIRPFYTLFTL